MRKRLDEKLERIRTGCATARDFILADAKDADLAFGIAAPGVDAVGGRLRSLPEYREQIRQVVAQGVVDIMLMSASTHERLAVEENLFADSCVTPAVRLNDSTDIWLVRGGRYHLQPSRPFRSASLGHVARDASGRGADLGLYSITFTNDLEADLAVLRAFSEFRQEAEARGMRYFLEVFDPNVALGLAAEQVPAFVNDHIVRCLAGVTRAQRPLFLKMAYHGPRPLEQLVAYDPELVVGILGGSAGTTRDAFQLLHDAQRHGARAALFGRKINHAEDPLAFVAWLRRIADGQASPVDAVRAYHADLARGGIAPRRPLEDDLRITSVPGAS